MHADGSPVAPGSPAKPGEVVVVYGYGFGKPSKPIATGVAATEANPVALFGEVRFDGQPLRENVLYAGITPGTVGVYQLNFRRTASFQDASAVWRRNRLERHRQCREPRVYRELLVLRAAVGWQDGQKCVPRWTTTMRRMGSPHCTQGSPSLPYTRCRF